MDPEHSIKFNSTSRLDMAAGYMDHVMKEAKQKHYHPTTATRTGGFMLSQTRQPMLKQIWDSSNKKQNQA
jgi:hypothetical protein